MQSALHFLPPTKLRHRECMRGEFDVWIFTKIPPMEAEIQKKESLLLVKFPLSLMNSNQAYEICRTCAESARYEFSWNSIERKPRYRRKLLVLIVMCPSLLIEHNPTYKVCNACADRLRSEISGQSPKWKKYWPKGICSASKVPWTIDWSQTYTVRSACVESRDVTFP